MSIMKMTLIGIQTALSISNKSVFDFLELPEDIDKDTVIDNILMEGGDFEVLYADPDYLRLAVGVWSKKHYRTFEKWIHALNLEYNPLENYDRMESWGDTSDNKRTIDTKDKVTLDTKDKRTLDTKDKQTRDVQDKTEYNNTITTEHEVSAYDSGQYQPGSKDTEGHDGDVTVKGTGTDTMDHTGTDTVDHTGTDTTDHTGTLKDELSAKHNGRIHGNIGVTTSQQMLQSELDIARFNIVQQITDIFMSEFCIMVYD